MVSQASPSTITEQFHDLIHANHMYGLWELAGLMTARPEPQAIPYMWPWSLMKQVVEPGKFASWIAPPVRGINHQALDFEYVTVLPAN